MEPEEENGQELIPIEQQTLTFYGKPIIVIRLSDGRPAVVLRFLCENMGLEPRAQIRRVRLTEAIADDLAYARVQTEGGPQKMAVLVLHGAAFWLATIDPKRVKEEEARAEVRRYQREVVDLLYTWAQAPRALAGAQQLVRTGPVLQPTQPAFDAPASEWASYYEHMALFYRWKGATDSRLDEMEQRQAAVESRLEKVEEISRLVPTIIERLGPETLTTRQQHLLKDYYLPQLSKATGKTPKAIYGSLYMAFNVPRYEEIPEAEWGRVVNWFRVQMERAGRRLKEAGEQETLFD